MIGQNLFRFPQHCMLMIFGFWKAGPISNSSSTSCKISLSVVNIGTISLVLKSLHPKPLQFFLRKREPDPIILVFQSTSLTQYVNAKQLNVLRLIKGTWGAAKAPLLTISRTLIRSAIFDQPLEYGMEAYYFLPDHHLTPLFKVQLNALRLFTGAIPSTPIICLQHACHEMPLHIKHRLLCLQYKVQLLIITSGSL